MPEIKLDEQFLEFLRSTPAALADFVKVIQRFLNHSPAPTPGPPPAGPQSWAEGAQHALTTTGISQEELDQLVSEAADADVIEKFVKYVEGFVAGAKFIA